MARILTCVEGVGDGGICPSGTVPELVEGYIFAADPTAFDASTAAEYFAYSFDGFDAVYIRARHRLCLRYV